METPMSLREGYIHMVGRWEWAFFTTNTFRNASVHPERADKLWRVWICKMNRYLFGHRWWKHGKGLYWCRASEQQKRGATHFHGLIGGERAEQLDTDLWSTVWHRLAGIAEMERPQSKDAVQRYVTKCIGHGGEIDFGGPLNLVPQGLELVIPEE